MKMVALTNSVVLLLWHLMQVVLVDAQAGKMVPHQKVAVPGVAFPTMAAWDQAGKLWVVGGPPKDTSSSIHVGVIAARSQGAKVGSDGYEVN
jgi:hypothetical protein